MTARAVRKAGEIHIEWGTVPNINKHYGGWMPVIWVNGRQHGDTYGRGYDRDEAELRAQAAALDEGARYIGDWKVSIAPR